MPNGGGQRGCAFCGNSGKLTKEHVLGKWITAIGLDVGDVRPRVGRLNQIGHDFGVSAAFSQTVRDVCGTCNHGWMSGLEGTARRVLPPLILGKPGVVQPIDLGPVAAWAHKTALVAMLVSSGDDRARGYGLPASEYAEMYAQREGLTPLPASQFWIGRYAGQRMAALQQVTPLVVTVDGMPVPTRPQAYLMTIVLGQLVLHGVRFTTPGLQIDLSTRQGLPQLWPADHRVEWPGGTALGDDTIQAFCGGRDLQARMPHVTISRWKPATDLQDSRVVQGMVELPTICGEHVVYFPGSLAREAMASGSHHAFVTSCECGTAYLIETEVDGAHCKSAGDAEAILAEYDALPGLELRLEDDRGVFVYKRLG
jgi:hypothetical protein